MAISRQLSRAYEMGPLLTSQFLNDLSVDTILKPNLAVDIASTLFSVLHAIIRQPCRYTETRCVQGRLVREASKLVQKNLDMALRLHEPLSSHQYET